MPKDDTQDDAKRDTEKGTKKDAPDSEGKRSKAAPRTHKNSGGDKPGADDEEAADTDSSNELEAVKTKKGEPDDNLGRRAEWFQKRHS